MKGRKILVALCAIVLTMCLHGFAFADTTEVDGTWYYCGDFYEYGEPPVQISDSDPKRSVQIQHLSEGVISAEGVSDRVLTYQEFVPKSAFNYDWFDFTEYVRYRGAWETGEAAFVNIEGETTSSIYFDIVLMDVNHDGISERLLGVYSIGDMVEGPTFYRKAADGSGAQSQDGNKKIEGNKGSKSGSYGDYEYRVKDDHVEITDYIGKSAEAKVPSRIAGLPVTEIGLTAFSNCTSLTDIYFPSGVKEIYMQSLYNCTSLKKIHIPSSVTEIHILNGNLCPNLQIMDVDKNNRTFCDVDGILFSKDKTKLLYYPEGKSDKNYNIPKSVTEIDPCAFRDSQSLKSLMVDKGNKTFHSEDGVVFSSDSTKLVCCPVSRSGSYAIPYGVREIGERAFYNCEKLQDVEIPDSVKIIGKSAFAQCNSLRSIVVPASVAEIGYAAFLGFNTSDIYYKGTEEQWNAIIPDDPEFTVVKTNGVIHYNA